MLTPSGGVGVGPLSLQILKANIPFSPPRASARPHTHPPEAPPSLADFWSIVDLQCCLVSGAQQGDPVIFRAKHTVFHILFHQLLSGVPCAVWQLL